MVEGLDLAVQDMKLAEEAIITLAPQYAYGDKGFQGQLAAVPPNATLTYHVHLVSFDKVSSVVGWPRLLQAADNISCARFEPTHS